MHHRFDKRTFDELPPEARDALVLAGLHGAATARTMQALVYAHVKKRRCAPRHLRRPGSRVTYEAAQKRLQLLLSAGALARRYQTVTWGTPPTAWLVPDHRHAFLSWMADAMGNTQMGARRALVAAELSRLGFVVGRDDETLALFKAGVRPTDTGACWKCVQCGERGRAGEQRTCRGATVLTLGPGAPHPDLQRRFGPFCDEDASPHCRFARFLGAVRINADVGIRQKSDGSYERLVLWIDDHRGVDEQWAEHEALVDLAGGAPVKVIVRPDDDSEYSLTGRKFTLIEGRLARMAHDARQRGCRVSGGGDAGHRRHTPPHWLYDVVR